MTKLSEAQRNILEQLQERFAVIAPGSLADELIAERREEAKRELESSLANDLELVIDTWIRLSLNLFKPF